MARNRISLEIKAAALADLHAGDQPAVVAERYGLPRNTVKSWRVRLDAPAVAPAHASADAPAPRRIVRPAEDLRNLTLAELVEANLRAKLIATQRIAEHVTRDEWLAQQNATAVAELFEAIDRSAIGVLDRLAAAHAQPAALPPADADDGAATG